MTLKLWLPMWFINRFMPWLHSPWPNVSRSRDWSIWRFTINKRPKP